MHNYQRWKQLKVDEQRKILQKFDSENKIAVLINPQKSLKLKEQFFTLRKNNTIKQLKLKLRSFIVSEFDPTSSLYVFYDNTILKDQFTLQTVREIHNIGGVLEIQVATMQDKGGSNCD